MIIADDSVGDKFITVLDGLYRDGLAESPTLVIRPKNVDLSTREFPIVTGSIFASGVPVRENVDLLAELARRELTAVRLVCVQQILVSSQPIDEALQDAARNVVSVVKSNVPMSLTKTTSVNLIAPVTGVGENDSSYRMAFWDDVILAPDDRPGLRNASLAVAIDSNATGLAVVAAAACGGVLRGVTEGIFDALPYPPSTTGGSEVLLLRLTVRDVVGGELETQLASAVLDEVAAAQNGPTDLVQYGRAVAPERAHRLARDYVDYLLNQSPWCPSSWRPEEGTLPQQLNIPAGFAAAARFNLQLFKSVPKWWFLGKKAAIEKNATQIIMGTDTGAELRMNPMTPRELQAAATGYLNNVETRISDRRNDISREALAVDRVSPDTWMKLRKLCFSAVDGGELPPDLPFSVEVAGERELLPPNHVVPELRRAGN